MSQADDVLLAKLQGQRAHDARETIRGRVREGANGIQLSPVRVSLAAQLVSGPLRRASVSEADARLLDRLLTLFGWVVSHAHCIAALYPDGEPGVAGSELREAIARLWRVLQAVAGDEVLIRHEPGVGYAVVLGHRWAADTLT